MGDSLKIILVKSLGIILITSQLRLNLSKIIIILIGLLFVIKAEAMVKYK